MPENKPIEFKGLVISFELLLTHIFPGFILLISIFISIDLEYDFSIIKYIYKLTITTQQFILSIILLFIFSTLLGLIIDLISSVTFAKFVEKYLRKYKPDININKINVFNLIKTNDDLVIYKHFFEQNIYIIDAYSNIALSMLFGCLAIFKVLVWFNFSYFKIFIFMLAYMLIIILLYSTALNLISSFYQRLMNLKEDRLGKNSLS